MKEIVNYHRFYALLGRLYTTDRDETKAMLVSSFTDGRTTHLHEMTRKEYDALCTSLEERTGWKEQLKKKRSGRHQYPYLNERPKPRLVTYTRPPEVTRIRRVVTD